MRKINFTKIVCIALFFSAIFSMTLLLPKNISAEESFIKNVETNEAFVPGTVPLNEVSLSELLQTYTNRSYSYSAGDTAFPEYYTMIEGNGTDEYGTPSENYDTYMMYVQNQDNNGLCWDFAATQSITTAIMKQTGEYLDFSEAWISLALASATSVEGDYEGIKNLTGVYVPGSGGNFYMYDAASRIRGLVLEQDYEYVKSYYVTQDTSSQKSNAPYLLEMYSKYATQTFLENYISVSFNKYDSSNKEQVINSMKQHIMNHGSISAGMYWDGTHVKEYASKYNEIIAVKTPDQFKDYTFIELLKAPGHAVSIIGWDDTYNNGEGAWIALNSWGDNSYGGLIYLEYDDSDFNPSPFFAYEYNPTIYKEKYLKSNDNLLFESKIFKSNAIGAKTPTGLQTDQQNIFYQQDKVELEYSFELSDGAQIDEIKVYYRNQLLDVADIEFNESSNTYSFVLDNPSLGSYKVAVHYSDSDQSKVSYNSFIVTDGLEFGLIELYEDSGNSTISSGKRQVYSTYISGNEIDVTVATSQEKGTLYLSFYKSSYSAVDYLISGSAAIPFFTPGNYWIYLSPSIPYDMGGLTQKSAQLMFINSNNTYSRKINLNIIKVNAGQELVFMEYYLDGGVNHISNFDKKALNVSSGTEIEVPTKKGYDFKGWYYDSEYKNAVLYSNGKYLLNSSRVVVSGNNRYASNNLCGLGDTIKTLCLYAKWEKTKYTINFNTNGGSLIESLIVDENGKIIRPSDPTKKGYVFKGWYTDVECNNLFDFENTLATENLTLYAKWEKSAFAVTFNSNGGSSVEEIYVDKNSTITPPTPPTKTGFTFVGWYTDEQLTQLFDFNDIITADLTLYAKWNVMSVSNVEISCEAWQVINKEFIINIKFSHPLEKDSMFSYAIKWYRTDKPNMPIAENSERFIKDIINSVGVYQYYAEVIAIYNGVESQVETSNILEVFAVAPIEQIDSVQYDGKGIVTWLDDNSNVDYFGNVYYAKYRVSLYQKNLIQDTVIATIIINSETNEKTYNFSENFTTANIYRVGIMKTLGNASVNEVFTTYFEISLVKYNTDTQEISIKNQYYDINSEIETPIELTKIGYTFDGWYYDNKFENQINFPLFITKCETITMFAKWNLNNLVYEVDGDLSNLQYDKNKYSISINASHELETINFNYKWFKLNGETYEEFSNPTNSFTVQYVAQSGEYCCEITAFDNVGRTNVKQVNFAVNMARAKTEIIYTVVGKYKYKGYSQTVEVVASLTRGDEEKVEIEISNNTFTNVPVGGKLNVVIFAPQSDNYESAQVIEPVEIKKAQSTLYIETQRFTYNGQKVIPIGTISNEEQKDKIVFEGEDIINVGTYIRKAVVQETTNYLPIEQEVRIEVIPAVVQIKAKNATGLWLIGRKNFDYEIVEGEIYGNDDLNIECVTEKINALSLGKYKITISTAPNQNYYVGIIDGEYTISIVPHILLLIIIALVLIFMILKQKLKPYLVEFEGEEVMLPPISATKKENLRIKKATREGYEFSGWYLDAALTTKFDGKLTRGKVKTLYAKWNKVDVPKPKKVLEKEIAQSFVENLFGNNKKQAEPDIGVEEIVEEQKEDVPVVDEKKQELDFLNSIINKATTETSINSSEEDLKNLIDRLSKNKVDNK